MQLYNTEFGLENSRKLASTGPHGACPIHFYLSLLPSAFREKATVYMVLQKTKTFLMMAALHQSDSRGWPTHRKQGLEHRSKAGDPTAKFTYLTWLIEQIGSLGAGGQRIIIIIILLVISARRSIKTQLVNLSNINLINVLLFYKVTHTHTHTHTHLCLT